MARYFVRFPNESLRADAQPMLGLATARTQAFYPRYREHARAIVIADLSDEERAAGERNGAKFFEDVQFYPVVGNPLQFPPAAAEFWKPGSGASPMLSPLMLPWRTKSLTDVLDHIRAPQAWAESQGAQVTIGIVDTGIAGSMSEFPLEKRSLLSKSFAYADPWEDTHGHGSMCACAAAATTVRGGRYNGVAKDALLMSLRTTFAATDIYKLFEWVILAHRNGNFPGRVVLSNSYGMYTCGPPAELPADHPYLEIVRDAWAEQIPVIFAAGNNHSDVLCNWPPADCGPNSIWGVNSIDEVLSVGTVNWSNDLNVGKHANSSRGPGQWAQSTVKPDCVAPTYGEIVWGNSYLSMEWWGTSGACPQAAGLAALLLAKNPRLTSNDVYGAIRSSCTALPGYAPTCVGHGLINCEAAVARV